VSRRSRLFFDDPAIEEMNRTIRMTGIARIVSYHADRRSFIVKAAQ
jgi:hypothetical protein